MYILFVQPGKQCPTVGRRNLAVRRPYTKGSRVISTIQWLTKVVLFSVHQTVIYGKHQIYNTLYFVHSVCTCLSILYFGMHLPSSNYKIECKQHPWKIHSFEPSSKPEADNDIFIQLTPYIKYTEYHLDH